MITASNVKILFIALLLTSGAAVPHSFAQDATPSAKVFIQQTGPSGFLGSMTFIKPDQTSTVRSDASFMIDGLYPGLHSLLLTAPSGMSTIVTLYRGDVIVKTATIPQISFQVEFNDELRLNIKYTLAYYGTIGVTSTPPGVLFELIGPNNMRLKGQTPLTFEKMPIGAYTVQYLPEGCNAPPPKSATLKHLDRIGVGITFSCAALKTLSPLTANILSPLKNTASSTPIPPPAPVVTPMADPIIEQPPIEASDPFSFTDVPADAWFAQDVRTMVEAGYLSGYKHANGTPSGIFGPGNAVNLAELAVIARRVAGLGEADSSVIPLNITARSAWYSAAVADAEARHWWLYERLPVDVLRPATRGEVLVTLLQALDISIQWAKGDAFRDVLMDTPYAAAIETAAGLGFVQGTSASDKPNFFPASSINRAELSRILTKILFWTKAAKK